MDTLQLYRLLATTNLLIIFALLADTFIFEPRLKEELFDGYTSVETRNIDVPSHWTNFIIAKSGIKYREPHYVKQSLNYGDTFIVSKSFVFRRPIHLTYFRPKISVIDCGALNEGWLGLTATIYVVIVSGIALLKKRIVAKRNLNERLIFSGTSILCVILFFYFY